MWNICSMSATTDSLWKRSKTTSTLLIRSGPLNNTLSREISWCWALESNTAIIWFSFWGLYTPKMDKYHHSSPSCSGGSNSASLWARPFAWSSQSEFSSWAFFLRVQGAALQYGRCSFPALQSYSQFFARWTVGEQHLKQILFFLRKALREESVRAFRWLASKTSTLF